MRKQISDGREKIFYFQKLRNKSGEGRVVLQVRKEVSFRVSDFYVRETKGSGDGVGAVVTILTDMGLTTCVVVIK